MGFLIDTNLFIAAERSRQTGQLPRLFEQLPEAGHDGGVFISVVTASELLVGVHRATSTPIRERRRAFVEAILSQFDAVPISLPVARAHANLIAEFAAAGRSIGTHDSWIAATGLAHGHAVVTVNIGEFSQVPGLDVIPIQFP